ncbi:hypothetical protein RintRC_3857 [Richelia intracellularis]|nr:hypothetical protein RintRC_3857 [Richelia intracellularis]
MTWEVEKVFCGMMFGKSRYAIQSIKTPQLHNKAGELIK